MASKGLTELWNAAMAAKPSDWTLMGVTCASTGLAPQQRSERWVAQAHRLPRLWPRPRVGATDAVIPSA